MIKPTTTHHVHALTQSPRKEETIDIIIRHRFTERSIVRFSPPLPQIRIKRAKIAKYPPTPESVSLLD